MKCRGRWYFIKPCKESDWSWANSPHPWSVMRCESTIVATSLWTAAGAAHAARFSATCYSLRTVVDISCGLAPCSSSIKRGTGELLSIIFIRKFFFTKTELKMWQRIGCGLTIVSADLYTWTIHDGGYVRAAGGKKLSTSIWNRLRIYLAYLDVYDSSGTNESQTASSKFSFKKVRREKKKRYIFFHRWRRVQES